MIMKIYYDNSAETLFNMRLKQKQNYLSQALKIATQYIQVESMDKFKENFSKYTIITLREKLGMPFLSESKLIDITGIELTRLYKLQNSFQRNSIDLNAPKPDFNIYTTNKKQELEFSELQLLCDQLNKWNPVNTFQLEIALQNKIINQGGGFIPNPHYITSL